MLTKKEVESEVFLDINDMIMNLGTDAAFHEHKGPIQQLLEEAEELEIHQDELCEKFNHDYDEIHDYLVNKFYPYIA